MVYIAPGKALTTGQVIEFIPEDPIAIGYIGQQLEQEQGQTHAQNQAVVLREGGPPLPWA
ncbi:hypothetical protein ADICEAN_00112 [Cesiribacter andamanensis AMV16]|uniref:Uncharacterized protein n=1 Tax=Cesiribacter andamanensis AMV16 TaxID=1279009 RepID=M7NCF7_9BACT|nr:hypothetical protein ADICEAN_00112 [Cesiribacter andamanensis AMV16]